MILGWLLSLTALMRLAGEGPRLAFVLAGLLVEALGMATLGSCYRAKRGER